MVTLFISLFLLSLVYSPFVRLYLIIPHNLFSFFLFFHVLKVESYYPLFADNKCRAKTEIEFENTM